MDNSHEMRAKRKRGRPRKTGGGEVESDPYEMRNPYPDVNEVISQTKKKLATKNRQSLGQHRRALDFSL